MSKTSFTPVDLNVNFPDMERELLSHWYETGVVKKYLERNKDSDKYFSFMDGPITANNPMGVHHAWGRTYKDLWQRYHNMKGYRERFQNGFDCQGLWVEVEVEKELGLHNKKDIENLVPGDKKASIAKFINLCKERVMKFSAIQTEQTKRLGNFMDWENSYFTMSSENNYMIWHFLKKCHERGLIYKGHDSVPWCPRCGTAISQHEMLTEDYKEAVHESIFFALPVEGEEYSLLVWTTTPWTIPANVAVAVHPDWTYAVWTNAETKQKVVILESGEWEGEAHPSKRVFEFVKGEWSKESELKGSELVGKKYKGPFDTLPAVVRSQEENTETFHSVIPAKDLVTPHEGTGLVHIAPGAGVEDFALGKEFMLPVIAPIDDEASYYHGFGDLSHKNAKKHPELIIEALKENAFLVATHQYKHRYPACWRCKTELVWRVVDEWYIAMDKGEPTLRSQMIEVAKKISWMPEFGLKRELDWLENMHDWLISKKRYWGLALPIWECEKCGKFDVIGGEDELKERATDGWESFEGNTPHKPWVDEIVVKCPDCDSPMHRIPDVGNPWLDAGIVPYSTISENNSGKPLYLENRAEWEKWFPIHFITESFPGQFKNWFYSMIAMSTVLEDTEPFKRVLGYGTLLAEDGRAMHKSWGNSIEFNEGADTIGADVMRFMYAQTNPAENMLFGYKRGDDVRRQILLKIWNSYNFFVMNANQAGWSRDKAHANSSHILDQWIISWLNHTITDVTNALDKFDPQTAAAALETFIDHLSNWYIRRSRDRVGEASEADFFATTHTVLVTLAQLLAPIMPFVSEKMYTNLTGNESVHLSDWPEADATKINPTLEDQMASVRELAALLHNKRKIGQVAVRIPLREFKYVGPFELSKELAAVLGEEVNAEQLVYTGTSETFLGAQDEEYLFKKENLDEEKGAARKLVRDIQVARKELGTQIGDFVAVVAPEWPEKYEEYIKTAALVKELSKGEFAVKPLS